MPVGKRFNVPMILSHLAAATLCAVLLLTCGKPDPQPTQPTVIDSRPSLDSVLRVSPALAGVTADGHTSLADVAERTVSSVVNISTTRLVRGPAFGPMFDDPLFRHFFGPQGQAPREYKQNSLGSGVIVSADGVVLTNDHVIKGAEEIRVTLNGGREIPAEVVGSDPKSDLAVLRLKGDLGDTKPLPVGDSSALRLGDIVLAIGNPFGVGQTVTMGIVSGKSRTRMGIVDYEDFIQTDAAINPGNSGGALVNLRGELVGINTAILSRTGGYQGVGFAIPTEMARPIMDSLLEHGKVTRGWLGVGIQDLTQDLATGLGLSVESGVLVSDVKAGSPAARAGLKRGDVIVKLDGDAIASSARLRNLIAAAGPDKKISLTLMRDGREQTVSVTLGTLDSSAEDSAEPETKVKGLLHGIRVTALNDESRARFSLPADVPKGVVVTAVAPDSPAAGAGLRAGDVILQVDKKATSSISAFQKQASAVGDRAVLLVWRGGSTVYLVVR